MAHHRKSLGHVLDVVWHTCLASASAREHLGSHGHATPLTLALLRFAMGSRVADVGRGSHRANRAVAREFASRAQTLALLVCLHSPAAMKKVAALALGTTAQGTTQDAPRAYVVLPHMMVWHVLLLVVRWCACRSLVCLSFVGVLVVLWCACRSLVCLSFFGVVVVCVACVCIHTPRHSLSPCG